MLEIWRMKSNHSLALIPGSLSPGMVAHDRVLSKDEIKLFDIYTVYLH